MANGELWVLGMPLQDSVRLSPSAIEVLEKADVLIGESRKIAMRWISQAPGSKQKPLYLLDEAARPEEKDWMPVVRNAANQPIKVCLFSDGGMPLLFDPGLEVMAACRSLGFEIRAFSGPTCWGTACALSGWGPPFLLLGFPPREASLRAAFWKPLRQTPYACVLMERPYRFISLLKECQDVFSPQREAFLAWELDSPAQRLIWGTLKQIEKDAARFEKTKGEFVLLIRGI